MCINPNAWKPVKLAEVRNSARSTRQLQEYKTKLSDKMHNSQTTFNFFVRMLHRLYENRILLHFLSCTSAQRSEMADDSTIEKLGVTYFRQLNMINLFIDIYLPNSATCSRRTWYQPIDYVYLLNIAMKSSSCTGMHLNWRWNSKIRWQCRGLCVWYVYRTSQLLLLLS